MESYSTKGESEGSKGWVSEGFWVEEKGWKEVSQYAKSLVTKGQSNSEHPESIPMVTTSLLERSWSILNLAVSAHFRNETAKKTSQPYFEEGTCVGEDWSLHAAFKQCSSQQSHTMNNTVS